MRFSTVLLDLDGTLVDSRPGILTSLRAALRRFDRAAPGDLSGVIGPPLQEVFGGLGFAPEEIEPAIAAFREVYEAGALQDNRPFDGIDESLRALVGHGAKLAVCTSKPWVYARRIVEQHGWSELVSFVSGPEMDGTRRHKPEILAHALAHLHEPPRDRAVMVGDRHYDVSGARAAGVSSVFVTWGIGDAEEQRSAAPDHVVGHPADIVTLARGVPGDSGTV